MSSTVRSPEALGDEQTLQEFVVKRILHVVGARPNFMKIAPVMQAVAAYPTDFEQMLVHTGQHYDFKMSQVFFDELELPRPDVNLEVGSGSHAWQTAQIMQRFEPVVLDYKPDWVVVPGDVNSTLACALVSSKLGIPVAHVEAGLRSFDRTMPEEINRVVADHLADALFTTEPSAEENLKCEGIAPAKVHFVGNVMIDSLVTMLPKAEVRWRALHERLGCDRFVLVTLHRPSNVDHPEVLREIIVALADIARHTPVVFPVHPRTRQCIIDAGLEVDAARLRLEEPLSYLNFLALEAHAAVVVTDSGGVQEETTFLGVPCLTARPNTERPVTITEGTNRLVASQSDTLISAIQGILNGNRYLGQSSPPALWDGCAARRIAAVLQTL
jgi:UDP-N-acetylglucosamine 2-epimerase (non-hydrolysing)